MIPRRPRGTGSVGRNGYILLQIHGVRYRRDRLVAEKALGKPLPPGAIVHHFNEMTWDDRPGNLVVCPDEAYHKLLHKRTRDLKAARKVQELLGAINAKSC